MFPFEPRLKAELTNYKEQRLLVSGCLNCYLVADM